ncbi:transposase, mutator type domain protein [Burkholderia pseudomallei MSHR4000]|nr:transposase, mutator type domain protein [Burkholderia pseudomallei MSHR4000]KGW80506.1 transposase, mutator type domain protein [Burkholderia pseudomallei MSHR456]
MIPFYAFAPDIRKIVYTTDEMHKSRTALRSFAMFAPPATVSARCLIWGTTASTG